MSNLTGRDTLKTTESGAAIADTELPAASPITDNKANPTAPPVDANISGYDGSDWDRIRVGLHEIITSFTGILNTLGFIKYNASPLSLNDGEAVPFQSDGSGNLNVNISNNTIAKISRIVHAISATLPDSGTYTSTAAYTIPDGVRKILFYIKYTRGSVGGQAKYKFIIGNGTESAQTTVIDQNLTILNPNGQQSIYMHEIYGPIPNDASAIDFTIPYEISGGETAITLLAAEVGVIGTPGVSQITLTAQYL